MVNAVGSKDLALQFVTQFYTTYKKELPNNDQLKIVAEAAFKLYKTKQEALQNYKIQVKDLNFSHKKKFFQAISKVLKSARSPWCPTLKFESKNQELFFNLIRGTTPTWSEMLTNFRLLKAVFWKQDLELLQEAKILLQNIFIDLYENIKVKNLTEEEIFHFEVIIGDLLCLFPFLQPQEGSEFKVPQFVSNHWQMSEFVIEKIPLTPKFMGSPCTAFGLNPKNKSDIPIFISKGTTYPTDDGCILSLLTDMNPFAAVGGYLFKIGKRPIDNWLGKHPQARLYGKSLGGTIVREAYINNPQLVSKVMMYGAPGFSTHSLKKLDAQQSSSATLNFFYQTNDLVPLLGKTSTHPSVHYYEIVSHKNWLGVGAHAHMSSTHPSSLILKEIDITMNQPVKRFWMTLALQIISIVVFPIFASLYVLYLTICVAYELAKRSAKFTLNKVLVSLPRSYLSNTLNS